MTGRRRPDTRHGELPSELRRGDYWKVLTRDGSRPLTAETVRPDAGKSNLTGGVWMVAAPLGDGDGDGYGIGNLTYHTVREEDDGTISVRPGDGSSNSILVTRGDRSWHGYIEHGVWGGV